MREEIEDEFTMLESVYANEITILPIEIKGWKHLAPIKKFKIHLTNNTDKTFVELFFTIHRDYPATKPLIEVVGSSLGLSIDKLLDELSVTATNMLGKLMCMEIVDAARDFLEKRDAKSTSMYDEMLERNNAKTATTRAVSFAGPQLSSSLSAALNKSGVPSHPSLMLSPRKPLPKLDKNELLVPTTLPYPISNDHSAPPIPLIRGTPHNGGLKENPSSGSILTDLERLQNLPGRSQFSQLYAAKNVIDQTMCIAEEYAFQYTNKKHFHDLVDKLKSLVSSQSDIKSPFLVPSKRFEFACRGLQARLRLTYEFFSSTSSLLQMLEGDYPFDMNLIKKLARSLLTGLHTLHTKGLLHADLTPENVFIRSQEAYMFRIGTSRILSDYIHELNSHIASSTRSGDDWHRYWPAPELMTEKGYVPKTDIWYLACLLIEIHTGKKPTAEDKSEKIDLFVMQLPSELQEFLLPMLMRNPRDRWSADRLLAHPFLSTSTTVTPTSSLPKGQSLPRSYLIPGNSLISRTSTPHLSTSMGVHYHPSELKNPLSKYEIHSEHDDDHQKDFDFNSNIYVSPRTPGSLQKSNSVFPIHDEFDPSHPLHNRTNPTNISPHSPSILARPTFNAHRLPIPEPLLLPNLDLLGLEDRHLNPLLRHPQTASLRKLPSQSHQVAEKPSQPALKYSRFKNDFEELKFLGKGGFGDVVKVRNRLDGRLYAVKRIRLGKSTAANDKIKREVSLLSQLLHIQIVRYYQAWIESQAPEHDDLLTLHHRATTGGREESKQTDPSVEITYTHLSDPDTHIFSAAFENTDDEGSQGTTFELDPPLFNNVHNLNDSSHSWLPLNLPGNSTWQINNNESLFGTDIDSTESGTNTSNSNTATCSSSSASSSLKNDDHSDASTSSSSSSSSLTGSTSNFSHDGNWETCDPDSYARHKLHQHLESENSSEDDDSTGFKNDLKAKHKNDYDFEKEESTLSIEFQPLNLGHKKVFELHEIKAKRAANTDFAAKNKQNRRFQQKNAPSRKQKQHRVALSKKKAKCDKLPMDILYIQMEYCETTLTNLIDSHAVQENRELRWKIFHQLIEALEYIHKQGIIHRDLKPSNVFLDSDNNVKLGDFGLATADSTNTPFFPSQANEQRSRRPSIVGQSTSARFSFSMNTRNNVVSESMTGNVGTALYVSPELQSVTRGLKYTEKVDIYSTGIIMFEMCVIMSTGMERASTIKSLRSPSIDLPQLFLQNEENATEIYFIRKMLHHDPRLRPSATEVLKDARLPPKLEGTFIQEINRTLTNPETLYYKSLINALFSQKNEGYVGKVLMEDSSFLAPFSMQELHLKNHLLDVIRNVFQRHGACFMSTPLLMPYVQNLMPENAVHIMDRSGALACLPYNLTIPFARIVARKQIKRIRRYNITRVYKDNNTQTPNGSATYSGSLEIGFDIVGPHTFSLLPDAEVIKVVHEIVSEASNETNFQSYSLKFNHPLLLDSIIEAIGIPLSKRPHVLHTLTKISRYSASLQKGLLLHLDHLIENMAADPLLAAGPSINSAQSKTHPKKENASTSGNNTTSANPFSEFTSTSPGWFRKKYEQLLLDQVGILDPPQLKKLVLLLQIKGNFSETKAKISKMVPPDSHLHYLLENWEYFYSGAYKTHPALSNLIANTNNSQSKGIEHRNLGCLFLALKHLQTLQSHAEMLGVTVPMCIDITLYSQTRRSGVLFQYVRELEAGKCEILASGGRYDKLIDEFRHSKDTFEPVFAVGATIFFDHLFQLVLGKTRLVQQMSKQSVASGVATFAKIQHNLPRLPASPGSPFNVHDDTATANCNVQLAGADTSPLEAFYQRNTCAGTTNTEISSAKDTSPCGPSFMFEEANNANTNAAAAAKRCSCDQTFLFNGPILSATPHVMVCSILGEESPARQLLITKSLLEHKVRICTWYTLYSSMEDCIAACRNEKIPFLLVVRHEVSEFRLRNMATGEDLDLGLNEVMDYLCRRCAYSHGHVHASKTTEVLQHEGVYVSEPANKTLKKQQALLSQAPISTAVSAAAPADLGPNASTNAGASSVVVGKLTETPYPILVPKDKDTRLSSFEKRKIATKVLNNPRVISFFESVSNKQGYVIFALDLEKKSISGFIQHLDLSDKECNIEDLIQYSTPNSMNKSQYRKFALNLISEIKNQIRMNALFFVFVSCKDNSVHFFMPD